MGRRDQRRKRQKKARRRQRDESPVGEVPSLELVETRDSRTRWSNTKARGGTPVQFEGTGVLIPVDFGGDDPPKELRDRALGQAFGIKPEEES